MTTKATPDIEVTVREIINGARCGAHEVGEDSEDALIVEPLLVQRIVTALHARDERAAQIAEDMAEPERVVNSRTITEIIAAAIREGK